MVRKLSGPALIIISAGAALSSVLACNAAVGGGVVALMGGVGYLAGQCYDRVRLRVRDAESGLYTCEADVWVSDGDSERRLRPCYSAALTEGKWQLTARRPGYTEASTELEIAETEGSCPHYTHSVELTLRREGAAAPATTMTPRPAPPGPAAPAAPSGPAMPATAPPAPAVPGAPPVPTRSFDVVPPPSADAGAPR